MALLEQQKKMMIKFSLLLLLGAFVSSCFGNDQFGHVAGLNLKYVSAGAGYFWGVTSSDDIYRCDNPCIKWTKVDGKLMQIDVGDSEVWGVNSAEVIYKRPVDGSGAWTKVSGNLKHVSASGNGYVWGVSKYNNIYKCKKPCNGEWTRVAGRLKQVDGGNKYVYGVGNDDSIWAKSVDGSGKWRRIPGALTHITASGSDDVFGVNKANMIYRCQKPCIGEWERMQGALKQCDATFNVLIGVAGDGTVWHHSKPVV